jgi:hypothetical protein
MRKYLIFIIMIGFLNACGDIWAPIKVEINNQTSDTIQIKFLEKVSYYRIDSDSLISVNPNQKTSLYEGIGQAINSCREFFKIKKDKLLINFSSGKTLNKDLWDINNWNCKGSNTADEGWILTFVITESDLE